jgi:uncharacterized protein (TIGR04255 family)
LDIRGATFFELLSSRFPRVEPVPFLLVPTNLGEAEPPAYRYYSEDGGMMVQYGPTLVAVNATRWPGFGAYLEIVRWVADRFQELAPASIVTGYSLGFYNRIEIKTVRDLSSLLRYEFNIDDDTLKAEFVCQFARNVDEGSLLTQIITTPGPAPEEAVQTVNVNNIVRRALQPTQFIADAWCEWLAIAHERAKGQFWHSLSKETQDAWDATVNAAR